MTAIGSTIGGINPNPRNMTDVIMNFQRLAIILANSTAGGFTIDANGGLNVTNTLASITETVPVQLLVNGGSSATLTTSGSLHITNATEPQNTVWAGNATANGQQPTFRPLVAADLATGATNTFVLTIAGGVMTWAAAASGGGGGTVTSIALTAPSDIFIVGGSPVTTAGTLNITNHTQSQNTVWAANATAGGQTPTFRLLVAADIPTLTLSQISDAGTAASANASTFALATATMGFLAAANNLSDVANATTSRANLGVGAAGTASGFVSAVSLALSAPGLGGLFSVSGSPVTTAGVLTLTSIVQVPHTIFSGPATGIINAQPTWRLLVAADIPNLTLVKILDAGTAASENASAFALVVNNLSDLTNAATARTNLGLGDAATDNAATFALATATVGFLSSVNNLGDVASVSTARTNLGLNYGFSRAFATGLAVPAMP